MDHAAGGCCASMAMNHAAGGCCASMAMNHDAPKGADFAMKSGTAGCSAQSTSPEPAAAAKAMPMGHEAGASCCAGMTHDDAKPSGQAMDHAMPGMPAMGDASMKSDMQVFHFLLENRADVRRTVTMLPTGIDTLTESDRPEIAQQIKTHVSAMYGRLKDGRRIHQRDPLFVELFEHADQIDATITYTDKGIRVVETSTDPAVAVLLHKHADTVSAFIRNGMPEMMKNHLE